MFFKLVSMFLVSFAFSLSARASENCEKFSGKWSNENSLLPDFYISDDCSHFKRDVLDCDYWKEFEIGGDFNTSNVYCHPRFTQKVRGSWNADKTELTIEELDLIEEGFHPAFGKGRLNAHVTTWRINPDNFYELIAETTSLSFNRDTLKTETSKTTEIYKRSMDKK